MRVRMVDQNGDMVYGHGSADFWVDVPQLTEQKIITGLNLFLGDFFLNTSAGMPWLTKVIGFGTGSLYDAAIQQQILTTPSVTAITSYSSSLNPATRQLTVNVAGQSLFGPFSVSVETPFALPPLGGYGVGGYAQNGFGQ